VAALLELLAATGLRISEAIALRWSDLERQGQPPRLLDVQLAPPGISRGHPGRLIGKRHSRPSVLRLAPLALDGSDYRSGLNALSDGGGLIDAGDQGVMRIATSYFVTEERCPGVSPAGIAFSVSSPRL
jgi:hypothetical protein